MGIPVNIISKFSQFLEAAGITDDDLLLMSQAQESGPDPFITKHITGETLNSHNDGRYIRKVDVYFSEPLDLLIIQK